jgi:hypothetical protein
MNIQKLFKAVKEERGQHSLVTIALELEDQGYTIILNNKLNGSNPTLTRPAVRCRRYLRNFFTPGDVFMSI